MEPSAPYQIHTLKGSDCPVCGHELHITRLQCQTCGSALEGHFLLDRLTRLEPAQLRFLESFIKNRGVIKDIEVDLGISYPTVKSRLEEVIRSLGYNADQPSLRPSQIREERRSILEQLRTGEINADQAASRMAAMNERTPR